MPNLMPKGEGLTLRCMCANSQPEIEAVTSFGFRGEALPSIASVSRLTLESRPRGADGWRIVVDHGERAGEGPAALPPGTRVRVEGLFDKVPARRKFLRSPRAEYAACLDAVKRLAMSRPDVAFSLAIATEPKKRVKIDAKFPELSAGAARAMFVSAYTSFSPTIELNVDATR